MCNVSSFPCYLIFQLDFYFNYREAQDYLSTEIRMVIKKLFAVYFRIKNLYEQREQFFLPNKLL